MSGRRFRILTLVDDFTRECLTLVVDTSLNGLRVARELDFGATGIFVTDNGQIVERWPIQVRGSRTRIWRRSLGAS
jgi:transposase InsO family protein